NTTALLRYGSGDLIYPAIGILKAGEDDDSPTVGFEIETQLADGFYTPPSSLMSRLVDVRLGHCETDSSIHGIEFDSHIFTWNKLVQCRKLFQDQFQKFSEFGLIPTAGAGLHIHIGKDAFANVSAFEKFFYLINARCLRNVWEAVARRSENSYSQYINGMTTLTDVKRTIIGSRHTHGVAVNQEHDNTYEIRIFQTTFSTDVLLGTIEMLLNLVKLCNDNEKVTFHPNDILTGQYASCLKEYLPDFRRACQIVNAVDLMMFQRLTRISVIEHMQECLSRGDIEGAGEWARRLAAQDESEGTA
ncbi:MAG: hypothetical protein IKE77_10145, partial [Erysipelotrichaceae bacterium]|nr:hypothetical protein [Erysipelotrichaceae bacterium]